MNYLLRIWWEMDCQNSGQIMCFLGQQKSSGGPLFVWIYSCIQEWSPSCIMACHKRLRWGCNLHGGGLFMNKKYAHDGRRKQTSTHLGMGYYLRANKICKKICIYENKNRGIMRKGTLNYSLLWIDCVRWKIYTCANLCREKWWSQWSAVVNFYARPWRGPHG